MSLSKHLSMHGSDYEDDDDEANEMLGDYGDVDVMNVRTRSPVLNQILSTLEGLVSGQNSMDGF